MATPNNNMQTLILGGTLAAAIVAAALTGAVKAQGPAVACPLNKTDPTIKGSYLDNFGGPQSVSASFWLSEGAAFEVAAKYRACTEYHASPLRATRGAATPNRQVKTELV